MKRYLILYIVLLMSCQPNKFIGTFSSKKSPYRFVFTSDSTFKYHYKEGFLYSYSFGRWSAIAKGKIKLNSFYKNRVLPLSGSEETSAQSFNTAELKIQVSIPSDEKKYYRCLIFINDRLFIEKSCDSISCIPVPTPVKSISLKITADVRTPAQDKDTLVSSEYYAQNNQAKSIDLYCKYNDSLFNYKVFNGYILNFSNGKLKFMKNKLPRDQR